MIDWFQMFVDWLQGLSWYEALALSAGLFVVGAVGSLAIVSIVLVRLPADYFQKDRPAGFLEDQPRVLRWLAILAKNLLGLLLIAVGVILSLPGVPGQGILTVLIGIMLVDFPGRRRIEQWIIRRPVVLRAVNRLRELRGKPPLILDPPR